MNKSLTKLKNNTFFMILGNFSSKLLVFLLLPLYTHVLTTGEYGISDIIFTSVNLAYPFFSLLMTEAILRFTLDEKSEKNRSIVFSLCSYISLIGYFVLIILILVFKNDIPILKDYYLYFLLFYFTFVLYLLFSQFSKGIEKIKIYAFAGILNTLVTILANILFLVVFFFFLKGYLLAYIIGSFFSSIYIFLKIKLWKYFLFPRKIEKKYLNSVLKYSIPMIPNSISWWISNSSDKYMLTYFVGIAENGIYSVSYKIPTLLTTFSNIFVGAWQLSAVEKFGSNENKDTYEFVYKKYSSLNIIIVSILIFLVKPISKILFASSYYEAWKPASILLLAYIFNTLAAFLGTVYTSSKKTSNLFFSTLLAAIVNVFFNFLFISKTGMIGAALATCISYLFVWIYRLIDTRKILKLQISLKSDTLCYCILIFQIICQYLLRGIMLYFMTAIFVILILFINREIVVELKKMIIKMIRKEKI